MSPTLQFGVLLALSAMSLAACEPKATPLAPIDTAALQFTPTSATEGIFPDVSVLLDPNNPFAHVDHYAVDAVNNPKPLQYTFFHNSANGIVPATDSPVAAYYVWATVLALTGSDGDGESQAFTGISLEDIYLGSLDPQLGSKVKNASDLPLVRNMAIAAFTEVLTQFPNAATHDASGTQQYELVTTALQGILDLHALPPTGWILITDNMGIKRAVKQ